MALESEPIPPRPPEGDPATARSDDRETPAWLKPMTEEALRRRFEALARLDRLREEIGPIDVDVLALMDDHEDDDDGRA